MTFVEPIHRKQRARAYLDQSLEYFENTPNAFEDGNPEKAGEFLWGSVATALKAVVMAKKGTEIRSHSQFWEIAQELTRETGDVSINESHKEANSLRSNFYDSRLSLDDVKNSSKKIAELVKKLIGLTENAVKD